MEQVNRIKVKIKHQKNPLPLLYLYSYYIIGLLTAHVVGLNTSLLMITLSFILTHYILAPFIARKVIMWQCKTYMRKNHDYVKDMESGHKTFELYNKKIKMEWSKKESME